MEANILLSKQAKLEPLENTLESTNEQTYSEAGLEQGKLWPKNTLCITIAANIAELAILSFDACFPDSVLGFIADQSKTDLNFIYYTLTHFQRELKHIGEGSVQDNINLGTFQDLLFPIPPLPEQKAIAAVLSSLDVTTQQIENGTRMTRIRLIYADKNNE